MDYTALLNEITNDPANLGYAQYVTSGNDQGIADLLNRAGAGTVAYSPIDRDTFLLNIAPAYLSLPTLSSTIQAKWDRILGVIQAATSIDMQSMNVIGLLSTAVGDGVLTAAQVAAINQRPGSRAEVLFGAGTVIQQSDVSKALRNM